MSDLSKIPEMIHELEARASKVQPYSHVQVLCGSRGWSGYVFGKACGADYWHPTIFDAIASVDARLSEIEDADGNLARTLGIEVAA